MTAARPRDGAGRAPAADQGCPDCLARLLVATCPAVGPHRTCRCVRLGHWGPAAACSDGLRPRKGEVIHSDPIPREAGHG